MAKEESTSSACTGSVDDSTSSEHCEESEECEPVALVLVLKAPKLSVLNRKCKVPSNRGRGGKHQHSSSSTSSETSIIREITSIIRRKII